MRTGAITNFASILIRGLGYSTTDALLLQAPANVIAAISIFTTLWLGDKIKRRMFTTIIAYVVATVGLLVLWLLPRSNLVGRLMGLYLIYVFPCGVAMIMSLVASNVAGSTKRSTVLGVILVAYCVGNLVGPQVFKSKEAPVYSTALITILACFLAAIVNLVLLCFLASRENKRRDALGAEPAVSSHRSSDDKTDRENLAFRYTL